MKYTEVEQAVRSLAAGADRRKQQSFAVDAVTRLTRFHGCEEAASVEFTSEAQGAFFDAIGQFADADAAQLRRWFEIIDKGTVSDGDMYPALLWALESLELWAAWLENHGSGPIEGLAVHLLESVAYEVSASVDDFLATAEMAAEFDRITQALQ